MRKNPERISLLNGAEDGVEEAGQSASSARRNSSQRSRRTPEASRGADARAKCSGTAKGRTRVVDGCDIVASGGELGRNSRTAGVDSRRSDAVSGVKFRGKRQPASPLDRDFSDNLLLGDGPDPASFGKSRRPASFAGRERPREAEQKDGPRASQGGIFRRSSAFLANLAHSASRIGARKSEETPGRTEAASTRLPTLTRCCSILSASGGSLRRSSSAETLPVQARRRRPARVHKSVSFSSDTSLEEKRAPFGRAAVHEAKVYRRGVLRDRSASEASAVKKVPSSWESTSEGRTALLRAARDADDVALNEIAAQLRKFGLGDMDVNRADGSGRTAVSYMAGNGASSMLELALSFDGVDPNIPDNEGNTPLHFAAQAGQTECLNILLQRCPDIEVDARNVSGFTPLMKAALQGRTKCAKILLFAGANPTLRDHGRGLRAEQWARFCGRYVCAEVIERFARHRLLERSTSCRWGSEPELAAKVLQGKVMPVPTAPLAAPSSGLGSKIRKVFRTTSGPDRHFSLVSQLTSAALCASSPALPKSSQVPPVVKSLLRPLSVPQLRVTLVPQQDFFEQARDKYGTGAVEQAESAPGKAARSKKKNKRAR